MEIKIKNLYGFNNVPGVEKVFSFADESKAHFIYGTNASGKSSFSKSIDLLANGLKYTKNLKTDNDSYSISLKYDDIDVEFKDGVNNETNCEIEYSFITKTI